ncbi:MAG: hypothetical protein WCI56_09225 [Hyphomicrobiales bacterium]
MIRFLFRFIGLLSLAAAFILLIYDGTKSIAGNTIYLTKVEDLWNALSSPSLTSLRRTLADWSLDVLVVPVLIAPSWLVLGAFGILLILLGRKKKPLIGYAR